MKVILIIKCPVEARERSHAVDTPAPPKITLHQCVPIMKDERDAPYHTMTQSDEYDSATGHIDISIKVNSVIQCYKIQLVLFA